MTAPLKLVLAVVLLAGAAVVERGVGERHERPADVRPEDAAVARALQPLGPLKAVLSATLWVALLDSQVYGTPTRVGTVAEGLLTLHPGLEAVRQFVAEQLIVNEAARAPDAARHRALVLRGLAILEDGLARDDSPRLHGALGRLLVAQARSDPRFAEIARQYYGALPEEVAIDELRRSARALDAIVLADLLVARGLRALRHEDPPAARRDLAEAEALLSALPEDVQASLGDVLDDLRAAWDEIEGS